MGIESDMATPLAAAVRAAGSQSAFGRIVSKKQSTIYQWLIDGRELPAELVQIVSVATGIPKEQLRPDIFGEHEPTGSVAGNSGARA